jgi:hypothetical protein
LAVGCDGADVDSEAVLDLTSTVAEAVEQLSFPRITLQFPQPPVAVGEPDEIAALPGRGHNEVRSVSR